MAGSEAYAKLLRIGDMYPYFIAPLMVISLAHHLKDEIHHQYHDQLDHHHSCLLCDQYYLNDRFRDLFHWRLLHESRNINLNITYQLYLPLIVEIQFFDDFCDRFFDSVNLLFHSIHSMLQFIHISIFSVITGASFSLQFVQIRLQIIVSIIQFLIFV